MSQRSRFRKSEFAGGWGDIMTTMIQKHYGPGTHESGSSQGAHAGSGKEKRRKLLREKLTFEGKDGKLRTVIVYPGSRDIPSDDAVKKPKPRKGRYPDSIRAEFRRKMQELHGVSTYAVRNQSVLKHGTHDQRSHGNWARGTSGAKLKETITEQGGVTVDIMSGNMPSTGFSVALPGREQNRPLATVNERWISDYSARYKDDIDDPKNFFGGWVEEKDGEPYVYLDVAEVFDDRAEAVAMGKKRDQFGIWDFESGTTIYMKDEK